MHKIFNFNNAARNQCNFFFEILFPSVELILFKKTVNLIQYVELNTTGNIDDDRFKFTQSCGLVSI